ncbi:MAG: hypothetical protein JWN52_4772 [Actinomycetia bacterium]|nr:hypothetical protein [Actinomycetes bacterium]
MAGTPPHEMIQDLEADGVIPTPFDLDQFIAQLAEQRGRRIRLSSFSAHPDAPSGLVISTRGTDYILHARTGSPFFRDHVIAHELGHLLLEHPGQPGCTDPGELLSGLMPHLDPALITRILGRSTYTHAYANARERDAEVFATLMLAGRTTEKQWADGGAGLHQGRHRTPDDEACRRSLDRLAHLWATLTRAVPCVVLRTGDGHLLRHPVQRLHRCLVEINDALLVLAPYGGVHGAGAAEVRAFPAGVSAEHARAIVEAAGVSAPLGSYTGGDINGGFNARTEEVSSLPTTLEYEVRRLELLAYEVRAKPRTNALVR